MKCSICGYALSPFDKTCPRCALNNTSGLSAKPVWVDLPAPNTSSSQTGMSIKAVAGIVLAAIAGGFIIGFLIRTKPAPANAQHAGTSPRPSPSMSVPSPAYRQPVRTATPMYTPAPVRTEVRTVEVPVSVPSPTKPSAEELTDSLQVAARSWIIQGQSELINLFSDANATDCQVEDVKVDVESSNSLTSPFMGYVFVDYRMTYGENGIGITTSLEKVTLIFGYQGGQWVHTGTSINGH